MKIKGGILWVNIAITIVGLIFDPKVKFGGENFKMPTFGENSTFLTIRLYRRITTCNLASGICSRDDRSI